MTRTLGTIEQPRAGQPRWLDIRAWEAGYDSYQDFLDSDYWAALRDRVFRRDRYRCQNCGAKRRLTVHHGTYARLGAERMTDVLTLCAKCHQDWHKQWRRRRSLRQLIGDGKRQRR
jgi:5-methylcytosine-specific restriction endonuclease McrA